MILFGNPLNVAVRKVRCSAGLRDIALDEVSVLRGADDPIFRAASPAGVIPALRDGSVTLLGSMAIIEYLDGIGAADPVVPPEKVARVRSLSVAHLADGPLAQTVSTVFQNSVFMPRFLGKPGNTRLVKRVLQSALPKILAVTEAALADLTMVDDRLGIAHLAVFAQCLCIPLSGHSLDGARFPAIVAAMRKFLMIPRVRATVARDAGLVGSNIDTILELLGERRDTQMVLEAVA